jgi:hypothetical protein
MVNAFPFGCSVHTKSWCSEELVEASYDKSWIVWDQWSVT